MKILALDLGDKHVGTALSDALGMFAKPYKTTSADQLIPFLQNLFAVEQIETVILGYPKTMRGTKSEQTLKIEQQKIDLEQLFPDKRWIFWDERLTSKSADQYKKGITKEDKLQSHSIAAAIILSGYLDSKKYFG